MARPSASAASLPGSRGNASRRATIDWICALVARPCPTTAFFICSAVYSATGRPPATSAASAAPRAWPSSNVLCGLTLTNTISTDAASGR
jgi:hypothetical protein